MDIEGWRLTFLINVPIGIGAALLAPSFLNESTPSGKLDLPGAVAGTLGLLGMVYGLTRAGTQPRLERHLDRRLPGRRRALLVAFVRIERPVDDPLMPFRILADRTRAASFVVMMLVPAAMFAMFYFLSISSRTAWATAPSRPASRSCRSARASWSRRIASSLMSRVDPRWLAGVGTLLAGCRAVRLLPAALRDGDLAHLGVHASYVSDLLPWIVVMSFGMGFVFVPLTLTAVHHLRGGLRHRLGCAQHDAADRRRAGPRHAEHGRDEHLHRAR